MRDKVRLRKISALRPNINWAAAAPLGIAIVLDGTDELSEANDEGRLQQCQIFNTGETLDIHGHFLG